MSIQKSAYEDSDSDSYSDVSHVLSEASSVRSYQLRKKDKGTKNVVERKDVFDTQQLEDSFKMSKNYKKYGTSDRVKNVRKTVENKRYHLRSDNDETLDSIEPVTGNSKKGNRNPIKEQQTERYVRMTKNQRESSFERKRSSPKNQRKRPSSPEESNKKKQKIEIDDFFQNASILPDGSDSEGIRSTKPAYQTFQETANNDRKRKDEENGKTAKRSGRNTTNSSSNKKKAEEVRSLYNEGYYTDNINSGSLHQESEYQDITDDDIYEKNKKKKPNKKDDWSDKALENFLETLREQPVKEMNDRRNKWIMFSKRLEKKGTKKTNDDCRKQVFTINSLEDVKGPWGMNPSLGEILNMTLLSWTK